MSLVFLSSLSRSDAATRYGFELELARTTCTILLKECSPVVPD